MITSPGVAHTASPSPDPLARPGWHVLSHIVLRHAGFPFEWMDRLAAPEASALAGELVAGRGAHDEHVAQLLARAFPPAVAAARAADDRDALRALSRVRRKLGRGTLRASDIESVATHLPHSLVAQLHDASAAAAHLDELQVEFEQAFCDEDVRAQEALRAIASDPFFQEAIFLSNPDMYRNSLRRFVEGGAGSQTFQRRLWSYLQRFCAKNDTASFFGPLSYARITGDEPLVVETEPGRYHDREVFYGFWVGKRLADAIAGEPAVKPYLRPRRHALCRFDGQVVTFTSQGQRVRLDPAQQGVLGAADGTRTVRDIAAAAGIRLDVAMAQVDRLVKTRILHGGIELPSTVFHPFDRLCDWVRALPPACEPGARWLAELDRFESLRLAFRAGSLQERDGLLAQMERHFTELTGDEPRRKAGQTYADRTLLYEECAGPNVRFDFGVDFFAELQRRLEPVLDLCAAHGALLQETYRRLGLEAVDALAQDGSAVPYPRFVAEVQRRQAAGELHVDGPALDGLRDGLHALVAERSDGHVARFGRADVQRLLAGAPQDTGSHLSPDVMLAASDADALRRGDYQIVLGEVHQVIYVWGSQLYFHPEREQVEQECWEHVRRVPGYESLATVLSERQHKGLLSESFPGTMIEVAAPASDRARRRLPIAALEVARDGEQLVLREIDTGEQLVLYTAGDDQVHLWALAVPRAMPVAVRLGAHTPRIELNGTIYQRERWQLAAAEWGGDLGDLALAQVALVTADVRRRHGLPRRVFAHVPSEPKPFYMDFDCPLTLRQLRQLLSVDDRITVTEMEPGPEGVWLDQPDGRVCCEFRMTAFRY